MRRKLIALLVAGVMLMPLAAALAADEAGAAPAAPAQDKGQKELTCTGVIEQATRKNKKSGEDETVFTMKTDDGTKVTFVASKKAAEGKKAKVSRNPADYVGKRVTVTGLGEEKTTAKGKKTIAIKRVKSITAVTQ